MKSVEFWEKPNSSGRSVARSPEQLSSQGTVVHFNVWRRLPDLNLRHKWISGELPKDPLVVQTASLDRGLYELRMISPLPDDLEYEEYLFLGCVEEYGIHVIGSLDSRWGAPNNLVPGLHGWDLRGNVLNKLNWEDM